MKKCSVIAVVDDDESVCRALLRLLRSSGIEARGFGSAEAFLHSLAAWEFPRGPHCALIDVQMPGTGGLALHRELMLRGERLPVIFITAHDSNGTRQKALGQGAVAYLLKPLAESALLDAVEMATSQSPPPEPHKLQ